MNSKLGLIVLGLVIFVGLNTYQIFKLTDKVQYSQNLFQYYKDKLEEKGLVDNTVTVKDWYIFEWAPTITIDEEKFGMGTFAIKLREAKNAELAAKLLDELVIFEVYMPGIEDSRAQGKLSDFLPRQVTQ
jgi:hypothetical protein